MGGVFCFSYGSWCGVAYSSENAKFVATYPEKGTE